MTSRAAQVAKNLKADNQKVSILPANRMPTRSNVRRIDWDVDIPVGTKVGDLLNPLFWSHVSGSTFNGKKNFIWAYWEDGSYLVHLFVKQYTQTEAKVKILAEWDLEEDLDLVESEKHIVKWTGPTTKWRVLRAEDDKVIRDGFSSKEEASEYIKNNL